MLQTHHLVVKELDWLTQFLGELKINHVQPTLHVDNLSAFKIIETNETTKISLHIDIKYNYIKQKYQEKLFNLKFVGTEDQNADFFTKSLVAPRIEKLLTR